MKIFEKKISDIKPYEKNAKRHPEEQIELLVKNIKKFGFTTPCLIDENNNLIAGHGRLEAVKKLNWKKVPCVKMEGLTDQEVKALRLADNKIAEMGEWDMSLAIEELKGLDEEIAELTGFDLDLLIEADDKDDVIPEDAPPVAKLGDLWALGKNRLLCGDATKKEDVERLMGGEKADMVFTDPPYNIGYDYWDYLDRKETKEYKSWCEKWFNELVKLSPIIVLTIGHWNMKMWFDIAKPLGTGIWIAKNKTSGSKISMFNVWEPILIYAQKVKRRGKSDIYDGLEIKSEKELINDVNSAIDFIEKNNDIFWINNKRQKNIGSHKCPKQVSLITEIIQRYSDKESSVLDIFGGSGSTLIACEKTNRKCYMMEIDPKYVSVILQRWADYTGQDPIREDGVKWSEICKE